MADRWRNPPPVLVVSGDHEYFQVRKVQWALRCAANEGRRVERIEGKDRDSLVEALNSTAMFSDPLLVVIEQPNKVDAQLVIDHYEEDDNDVVVLLDHPGKVKVKSATGKVVKAIPKTHHASYEAPKPWEMEDAAIQFCRKEARGRGKEFPERLARALVRHTGTDFGRLRFEVLKLCLFTDGKEVSESGLRATVAPIAQVGFDAASKALGQRQGLRLMAALSNIKRTHGDGSGTIMQLCGFFGASVTKWVQVASLLEARPTASPEELGAEIGMHPYGLKLNVLPPARRWGAEDAAQLLRNLAETERSIRMGVQNPWIKMEALLLSSCSRKTSAR